MVRFFYLSEARSRLYRLRLLQRRDHFAGFFKLCKSIATAIQTFVDFLGSCTVLYKCQLKFVKFHERNAADRSADPFGQQDR